MTTLPRFSIVVPVYNRPGELAELMASIVAQPYRDLEVVVVEDGSVIKSEQVLTAFQGDIPTQYHFIPNGGPGPARNFGVGHARGTFIIFLDSDCLLPLDYFAAIEKFLVNLKPGEVNPVVAWGGPDAGHESFTPLQQAMAYTMSSVLTTGGIRGGRNASRNFQPRSFNMGMHRKVFEATGGFRFDRSAEDIELSIRMKEMGFTVALVPDAFVWHKRRTTLGQFFRQVRSFGSGRAAVTRAHPGTGRLAHWLPLVFTLGLIFSLALIFVGWPWFAVVYAVYLLAVFTGASVFSRSIGVGFLALPSVIVQLVGYAIGFVDGLAKKNHNYLLP